jgi:hypothetical protein
MPNRMGIIRNTSVAFLVMSVAPETAFAYHNYVTQGMYVLTAAAVQGGTCTQDQMLPPFAYLLYNGTNNSGSKFYYYGNPGAQVDLVTLPKDPGHLRWRGDMTWTLNPLTFTPPSVTTSFHLDFTPVDDRAILVNGEIAVPTSAGGTCTEIISYTGTRTG